MVNTMRKERRVLKMVLLFWVCIAFTGIFHSNEILAEQSARVTVQSLPELTYCAAGKQTGWSPWTGAGRTAGSLDAANVLTGFRMNLDANGFLIGSVQFRGYFSKTGWSAWSGSGGTVQGGSDNVLRVLQIKTFDTSGAQASSYDVYYRVYAKNKGWLGWACNGEEAGDYSSDGAVLGMQAVLVPKIRYAAYYSLEGEQKLFLATYYPDLLFEPERLYVGGGREITGVGFRFVDNKLNGLHAINTTIYTKAGQVLSGNSSSNTTPGIYAVVGKGQGITGYYMQFMDEQMKERYDIEHMSSAAGCPEEEWKTNTALTGAASGSKVLEMVSARIVPKNYEEGARACISEQFLVGEDGFSFINTGRDFGYPSGYRIPEEKYTNMFGLVDGHVRYLAGHEWNGSCYGMALTSQAFYHHMWNIDDFTANVDGTAESVYGLSRQLFRKSKALTDLVEYAQLSYGFGEYGKEIESKNAMFANTLFQYPDNRFVMNVWEMDSDEKALSGHAVVPLGIQNIDAQNYKIRLYDVNYAGVERYATYNSVSREFHYDKYNAATLVDVHQMYQVIKWNFNKIAQWASGKTTKTVSSYSESKQSTILLEHADVCEVLDEDGKQILDRADVKVIPPLEENGYTIYQVPKGHYRIKVKNISGDVRVTVLNEEVSIAYDKFSGSGIIDVTFQTDETIDSEIRFADKKAHDVQVHTYDKHKNTSKKKFSGTCIKAHGVDKKSYAKKVK